MWSQVQQALNQSAAGVMMGVAHLIPGTIALVVSVLIAAILGGLLRAVLRRTLTALDFDRRVAHWGWSDLGSSATTPTRLVTRVAGWGVLILGFLVGIAAFDPTLTSQLTLRLFGSAMNLLTALVILIAGNLLARSLARGALISLVNMNVQQARLLSLGVKWLVLILTAAMALDHLNIGGRIVELAFGILFGGIVLALALAVGLRSKDVAEWSMTRPPGDEQRPTGPPVDHL